MSQSPIRQASAQAGVAPVNPQTGRDGRPALTRFSQFASVQGLAGAANQVVSVYQFSSSAKHDIQSLWHSNAPPSLKAQTAPGQQLYEEHFLLWAQNIWNNSIRMVNGVPTCGPLGGWNPQNGGKPVTHLYLCEVTSAHVILSIASFRRTGLELTERKQGTFLKVACDFIIAEAKRQDAWTPDETPGQQDARYREVCAHNEVLLKEWLRTQWYRVTGNQARYSSSAYRKAQERLASASTPVARKKARAERTAAAPPNAEQAAVLARQAGGNGAALHAAANHNPRPSAQRRRSALAQVVNVDHELGLGDGGVDSAAEYTNEEEEEEEEEVEEEDEAALAQDDEEEEDEVDEESSEEEDSAPLLPPRGRGRGAAPAAVAPRGGRGSSARGGRGGSQPVPPEAVAQKFVARGGANSRLGRGGPRGRG